MTEPVQDARGLPRFEASMGGVRHPIAKGTTSAAMGERSVASFTIDLKHLAGVDLTAPVQLLIITDTTADEVTSAPRFTGDVVAAQPSDGGLLDIEAEGGRELVESTVGLLKAEHVSGVEVIHLIARQSGFPDERLELEGLDELPLEVFIVEAPVVGLTVQSIVKGNDVEFIPVGTDDDSDLGPFAAALEDITTMGGRPTARARTYVSAHRMYDAEQDGLKRIHLAVDALLATGVYGFSRDPWNRDLPFDREQLRARPTVVPVVFTQGVATGRRWIHALAGASIVTTLDISASFQRWAQVLTGHPSEEIVRALRALRDMADEGRDTADRCHAFSTVLEYYAASSKPSHVVSKPVKKQVLAAIRGIEMTPAERDRLIQYVGQVNNPPLLARMRHQVQVDGTPVSDAEWKLVANLRNARNKFVHGHAGTPDEPTDDQLRWGVSLASRLLLYRWVAETKL